MTSRHRLTRLRWGVRAVLTLGVAASVTANVLHARSNPISQAIAGWPPIALLLTVELISRIPINRRSLAAVRIAATALIAGIAAWVSYWHMAGVAARYGETGASAYLLPLSVDGLIVVGSVCLVELGGNLTTTAAPASPTPQLVLDPEPGNAIETDNGADRAAKHPTEPEPPAQAQDTPCPPPTLTTTVLPAAAAPTTDPESATFARRSRALAAGRPPSTVASNSTDPHARYTPTGDDDTAMYQAWLHSTAGGHEPSGADLARATGRADDSTGIGRRAARRYRDAHALDPTASAPAANATTPPAKPHRSRQPNDSPTTLSARTGRAARRNRAGGA